VHGPLPVARLSWVRGSLAGSCRMRRCARADEEDRRMQQRAGSDCRASTTWLQMACGADEVFVQRRHACCTSCGQALWSSCQRLGSACCSKGAAAADIGVLHARLHGFESACQGEPSLWNAFSSKRPHDCRPQHVCPNVHGSHSVHRSLAGCPPYPGRRPRRRCPRWQPPCS
jgi:hypothetical protein